MVVIYVMILSTMKGSRASKRRTAQMNVRGKKRYSFFKAHSCLFATLISAKHWSTCSPSLPAPKVGMGILVLGVKVEDLFEFKGMKEPNGKYLYEYGASHSRGLEDIT